MGTLGPNLNGLGFDPKHGMATEPEKRIMGHGLLPLENRCYGYPHRSGALLLPMAMAMPPEAFVYVPRRLATLLANR